MMQEINKDSLSHSSIALVEEIINVIFGWINTKSEFVHLSDLERNRQLGILTTNISSFVEISTLAAKYAKVTNPELKDSHISLLFIMKAINNAFLKSDWDALEELIKYELKDNLTQWKINLIPQLKKNS
ncbi:MAG: hypothetical protein WCY48_04925 [Candidatus Caldatribacteriota bacterium]